MLTPADLREIYGPCYISELPDGQLIPWKMLSLGERLEYQDSLNSPLIPPSIIEDEIFKKCVLDSILVEKIYKLKAGTVSTVAQAILAHSGPSTPEEFNNALQVARNVFNSIPMHQYALWICIAFPAYTPDAVYDLPYDKFILRLAQAEYKLKMIGMIEDDLDLTKIDDKKQKKRPKKRPKPKHDSAKLKKAYEDIRESQPKEYKQTIITDHDVHEIETMVYTGHEKEDSMIHAHNMLKTALPVYGDYIDQMKRGEKVKIKSHDERVTAAKERVRKNKEKFDKLRREALEKKNKEGA